MAVFPMIRRTVPPTHFFSGAAVTHPRLAFPRVTVERKTDAGLALLRVAITGRCRKGSEC